MKKGKILFAFIVSLCMMTTITHANDERVNITYVGNADNFIKTTDKANAFEDMMPGEEKIQKIRLINENYDSMKFFVKVKDTVLLDKQKGNIVYDITFKKDGEVFYSGKIGGADQATKMNLDQDYLLRDLKKGEVTEIEFCIKIDGTSMTDAYQGANGNLGIVFSVEHSDDNKVAEVLKKIPVINQIPGVNTGDSTKMIASAAAILASLCMIVYIVRRKRGGEDENA